MTIETFTPLKGHCTCKTITYDVLAPFLSINCCHCTWCQRETGSAFVLNAIIETSNFHITSDTKPVQIDIPSPSGKVIMVEHGEWMTFVRAGTLDDEGKKIIKPDIHVFTSTKLDRVDLTGEKERGVPVVEGTYFAKDLWRKDALERFELLKQKMKEAGKGPLSSSGGELP